MKRLIATVLVTALVPSWAVAQDFFIYPSQGQSQEQQDRDRFECHSWAVQQSGFDPMRAPAPSNVAPPPKEASQGGILRGGARGAAVGVVGGAIAGDAGKGAAIGAAGGALIGGFRRNDQRRRQEQEQRNYQQARAQEQAALDNQRNAYNRAVRACLEGRGYTVS